MLIITPDPNPGWCDLIVSPMPSPALASGSAGVVSAHGPGQGHNTAQTRMTALSIRVLLTNVALSQAYARDDAAQDRLHCADDLYRSSEQPDTMWPSDMSLPSIGAPDSMESCHTPPCDHAVTSSYKPKLMVMSLKSH